MPKKLFINNAWVESNNSINSWNPATLDSISKVYIGSSENCRNAIQAAKSAFPDWKSTSLTTRKNIFRKARAILHQRSMETAELITMEKGSPLAESLASEVLASLEALSYYINNLDHLLRSKKLKHHTILFLHKKGSFHFEALGPTLVISPWNYPFMIPFLDILSSMAAGNTVVLRPSTTTPLCGLKIGEIFQEAGLPEGVLNIVPCKVKQAEEMATHPDIQLIRFTGSVPIGRRIMELASKNLTNIVLELGGKDPMIVLEDADFDRATQGAVWGAFFNCGQSCGSVERVYVENSIADKFIERVSALTQKLVVGDPWNEGIDIGPMTTAGQRGVVEEHILDARQKGAKILSGGHRIKELPGYFLNPTVLSDVNHSMKIMHEETFGPAMPVMSFTDIEEAITLANNSDFGLTASIWTKNRKKALQIASRIESGTVTINDHMITFVEPAAIWGGIKQTGIGRTHGPFGFRELGNPKLISRDFANKNRQLWWYPYDKKALPLFKSSLALFHDVKFSNKLRAIFSFLPHFNRIKKGTSLMNFVKGFFRIWKK